MEQEQQYEEQQAIVPVSEGAAVQPFDLAGDARIAIKSTMDRAATIRAINNSERYLSELPAGTTLYIRDVVQHIVQVTSPKTGEVTDVWRTVVIDRDGMAYGAVSKGVYGSIRLLAVAYGSPPWEPPLPLVVKRFRTGFGPNTGMKLDLAPEAED